MRRPRLLEDALCFIVFRFCFRNAPNDNDSLEHSETTEGNGFQSEYLNDSSLFPRLASFDDKLQSARRLESNGESLMYSGTTDGDMPNGVCQQKDLCATPAVSKVAQSLEFTRWGDWPTRGGPLAVETGGPKPRRGDPGPITTRRSPGRRRVRPPVGFHLTM